MQGCITTLPNFQNIFPLNASNQAHKSSERESYRGSLDGINRYKPTTNAENLLLKAHALMCRREISTAHASPCVSNGTFAHGGTCPLEAKTTFRTCHNVGYKSGKWHINYLQWRHWSERRWWWGWWWWPCFHAVVQRDPRSEVVATSCGRGWPRHIKGADHAGPLIQGPNRTQKQAPNFPYLSSS